MGATTQNTGLEAQGNTGRKSEQRQGGEAGKAIPQGFVLLGSSGLPAESESMVLRLSNGKIGLGANAWRALGEPTALHVYGSRGSRVVLMAKADASSEHALPCEWSQAHENAYIRNAKWLPGALGLEGQTLAVPVSLVDGLLRVDPSSPRSARRMASGGAKGASKGGSRASRGGG
jgi:hypothetical protein